LRKREAFEFAFSLDLQGLRRFAFEFGKACIAGLWIRGGPFGGLCTGAIDNQVEIGLGLTLA
jgi:hypothetical protein